MERGARQIRRIVKRMIRIGKKRGRILRKGRGKR